MTRYPKPPTGWNDIHEQIVNLYILTSATDEFIKRIKFQHVMDNTHLLSTNAMLFPPHDNEHGKSIRLYANNLIQTFRRSKKPSQEGQEIRRVGLFLHTYSLLFERYCSRYLITLRDEQR